jgi:O-antigen/teichoic acid export membrane protein
LFKFALWFTMRNALLLSALLLWCAHPVAAFFGQADSAWLLQLSALCIPCGAFWPVLYKYCVARFKIVEGILYGDIIRPILRVGILLLFIFLGFKSLALIGCEILVGAILIILGLYLIHKNWKSNFFRKKTTAVPAAPEATRASLTMREKFKLFWYAVPFLPLNLTRGDRLILLITAYFLVPAQIGILGVALKIAALSQVILTGLNFVFRPMVAKLYASRDLAALDALYKAITRWIFILTLPVSYIMLFHPAAVLLLFGEKFSGGGPALVIIAAGYLFEYGTSATQVIINMTGKSWLSLFNQICYFILIAALGSWLIPTYGTTGAALAIAAAIMIINLMRLIQSYRIIKHLPYSTYLAKPILAAAGAGLLCHLIPFAWPAIAGFILLYGAGVWALGIHTEDKTLWENFYVHFRQRLGAAN